MTAPTILKPRTETVPAQAQEQGGQEPFDPASRLEFYGVIVDDPDYVPSLGEYTELQELATHIHERPTEITVGDWGDMPVASDERIFTLDVDGQTVNPHLAGQIKDLANPWTWINYKVGEGVVNQHAKTLNLSRTGKEKAQQLLELKGISRKQLIESGVDAEQLDKLARTGRAPVLTGEGEAKYPAPLRESVLTRLIKEGVSLGTEPDVVKETLRAQNAGGSSVVNVNRRRYRGRHRHGMTGPSVDRSTNTNHLSNEQLRQATEAEAQLNTFAHMESKVQEGGQLPTRDEVYGRLFPDRQSGHHRKEDIEAVDAAVARLEHVENRRLMDAAQDFASQGRAPSEHELIARLHPGRPPEDLSTDELRDVSIALQNISESPSVHSAIIGEFSDSVKTGGRIPAHEEVSKRLFPYKHGGLSFSDKMEVDKAIARLMADKADSVASDFIREGKTPAERDISERLFGVWYPGNLSATEKWTVARVQANIVDRVAQPLSPAEAAGRKPRRIARVAGAVAMAVSMAATNIFGVQTGPTHPSVSTPVVAARVSTGVSNSRQTTSQPR